MCVGPGGEVTSRKSISRQILEELRMIRLNQDDERQLLDEIKEVIEKIEAQIPADL